VGAEAVAAVLQQQRQQQHGTATLSRACCCMRSVEPSKASCFGGFWRFPIRLHQHARAGTLVGALGATTVYTLGKAGATFLVGTVVKACECAADSLPDDAKNVPYAQVWRHREAVACMHHRCTSALQADEFRHGFTSKGMVRFSASSWGCVSCDLPTQARKASPLQCHWCLRQWWQRQRQQNTAEQMAICDQQLA
jgi:hypothetical protein